MSPYSTLHGLQKSYDIYIYEFAKEHILPVWTFYLYVRNSCAKTF
jgi:hypothetical protein